MRLVEDCAQSHGAAFNGKTTGTFGDIGCFSFYPSKNLGAFGDAGAIVTDDKDIAAAFKMYRNYGSEKRYYNKVVGANSRLDEMQAGLLRVRLKYLDEINAEKEKIAEFYSEHINNAKIIKPDVKQNCSSVWHQYVIRSSERDELIEYLKERNIGTIIHYPIPPHLAEAYQYLGYKEGDFPITETYAKSVLSLPVYNGITDEELQYVADEINKF